MRSALLCASSAERIFIILRLSRSAERSKRIFTGGVVTANGSCSAAFCESAALRGANHLRLTVCALSVKAYGFARFPLLSLRDIFPRSGGSLSSKGEPRARPEAFSL